jgi:hypothetical protein
MQTLQIDKANAMKLYPTASPEFKQMLLDSFGEKFFEQKITDRVKTFEDACEVLDLEPDDVLHSAHSPFLEDHISSIKAYCKLIVIAAALNQGWSPDWLNENQQKWYPYFNMSGFGFSCADFGLWYSTSGVGSRLCFKSRTLALYAGKQFADLYKEYFLIS